jgi:hypothetical protein
LKEFGADPYMTDTELRKLIMRTKRLAVSGYGSFYVTMVSGSIQIEQSRL